MKQSVRSTGRWILGLAVLALLGVVAYSYYAARRASAPSRPSRDLLSNEDYATRRKKLLVDMHSRSFSGEITLSAAETNADHFLSLTRSNETAAYKISGTFPPSKLFFEARTNIEQSRLFPILKKMPKGGLLHVHDSSSGRCEFVLTNILRRSDCFIYWSTNLGDSSLGLVTFTNAPPANNGVTGFFAANALRERLRQQGVDLDEKLRLRYMLDGADPRTPDIWSAFANWFCLLPTLVQYRPVFQDYLRDAFKTWHDDGISHVEIRVMAPVGRMHDFTSEGGLNTNYTEEDTVQEYVAARDYVRRNFNPHFSLKLILTGYRDVGAPDLRPMVTNVVDRVRRYRQTFPDLIVGCDWVGEEDGGQPTAVTVPMLRAIAEHNATQQEDHIHFYFHDGETAWPGNDNLIDAVMLGTKRIGHGFNLFQLPAVEHMVRTNRIALEVCPISNQLLRLMADIRTHPAVGYMNGGIPCVLGSDDPAIFGNDGLTYDFWEAYYAWGLDLRALKQLAENSLVYSALEPDERVAARNRWRGQWDEWIQWVLAQACSP